MQPPNENQLMPTILPVEPPEPAPPPEPGVLPDSPRNQIYRAYLDGDGSEGPWELAARFNRPRNEVTSWFREGNWVQVRRDLAATVREHLESSYQEVVTKNRVKVVTEQLAMGEMGEELITDALRAAKAGKLVNSKGETMAQLSPSQLKTLMEAAVSATTIRARAVGLSEKSASDAVAKAQAEAPAKFNLLVIGGGPVGPSAPVKAPPIDITSQVKQ
jgi:hypothetical protein